MYGLCSYHREGIRSSYPTQVKMPMFLSNFHIWLLVMHSIILQLFEIAPLLVLFEVQAKM